MAAVCCFIKMKHVLSAVENEIVFMHKNVLFQEPEDGFDLHILLRISNGQSLCNVITNILLNSLMCSLAMVLNLFSSNFCCQTSMNVLATIVVAHCR